jgi:signal transduction histidine kinase/DNA-binding LytR/AlgR family response regulator
VKGAPAIELLLIEDSPGDACLVREHVETLTDTPLTVTHVSTLREAVDVLRGPLPDAILLDLNLPDSCGLTTLERLRHVCPDVPALVVTGELTPHFREALIDAGATECISKSSWTCELMTRSVRYAVALRRAEGTQRQMERLLAASPDAVLVVDASGHVRFVNETALKLFGREREDFVGELLAFAVPQGRATRLDIVRGTERRIVEMRAVPVEWEGHSATMVSMRDTTDSARMAEQLFQAQKMEAVGLLAGGIAHDFNNLITVILAYGISIKETLQKGDPRREDLTQMLAAADRATALTRQLLTFARRQPVKEQVLQLDTLATGMQQLMTRALPASIKLTVQAQPGIWPVIADAGQLEQVLLNLVVNARDAMPKGGSISVTVANREETTATEEWGGGPAVLLRIGDTGAGIPPEILAQIFEPFFTTKEPGKGTGLGLATCYGIVRQAGGAISVESEVGKGTTFSILLPRASDSALLDGGEPRVASLDQLEGHETICVVEDDEPLRRSIVRTLRRYGYSILTATNGEEATRVIEGHDGVVDLLVTDFVMPRLGGGELIESLRRTYPRLKVLCITGYAMGSGAGGRALGDDVAVLYKPFEPIELVRSVRGILSATS